MWLFLFMTCANIEKLAEIGDKISEEHPVCIWMDHPTCGMLHYRHWWCKRHRDYVIDFDRRINLFNARFHGMDLQSRRKLDREWIDTHGELLAELARVLGDSAPISDVNVPFLLVGLVVVFIAWALER